MIRCAQVCLQFVYMMLAFTLNCICSTQVTTMQWFLCCGSCNVLLCARAECIDIVLCARQICTVVCMIL